MKICSKCKKSLPLEAFNRDAKGRFGRQAVCKECRKAKRQKEYAEQKGSLADLRRREKMKQYGKEYRERTEVKERYNQWREDNKEQRLQTQKDWYEKNKYKKGLVKPPLPTVDDGLTPQQRREKYQQEYRNANKDKMREYHKQYRKENSEKIKESAKAYRPIANQRARERRKSDPNYKIKVSLRGSIRDALKRHHKGKKVGSAVKDLGCSIDELVTHLESKFYPHPDTGENMTWENHGRMGWHIDHIIPLSAYDLTDREQFLKACNYNNLQPLWWMHNQSKGGTNREFIIKPLERKHAKEELYKELQRITDNPPSYEKSTNLNKITTHFNPHFYEVENDLWIKSPGLRQKLIANRKKYLNKDNFTDMELLRGFKISGLYYGFSHHSPFWIKQFIADYGITSIYDPCGGWGHRLLGSHAIKYIYNDVDSRSVQGAMDMTNYLNIENKTFYCKDAATFTPEEDYEAVFTCPPYFNIEKYTDKNTSTTKFPRYNEWLEGFWRGLIKSSMKPGVKYFAYIMSRKLVVDMNAVCESEGLQKLVELPVGKSNPSHFNKKDHDNRDLLVIFKKY